MRSSSARDRRESLPRSHSSGLKPLEMDEQGEVALGPRLTFAIALKAPASRRS
jgi:hypothetical protein